ncbi:MAG: hydantoinase/oxoprolinase family protein [Halobacteriota archaeon]|nr:hydantoinase/oxoprolinase family protein [Halobacteriota archaeon]
MILGIDIGGANTKIVSSDGSFAELHYLPLWKESNLLDLLIDVKKRTNPYAVGVVMTGELSDAFESKEEGIQYIYNTVNEVFPEAKYLTVDFSFQNDISGDVNRFFAANWAASSSYVSLLKKDVIFVDMGSTTTDIIPISDGVVLAEKSDYKRLMSNQLIYAGVLRTNVACMVQEFALGSAQCKSASELFAITADVYLLLEDITSEDYTCDVPDWYAYEGVSGKDIYSAMNRLARVVCCDIDELGEQNILSLAKQVKGRQIDDLVRSLSDIKDRFDLNSVVACGLGEFLVEDATSILDMDCSLISKSKGRYISLSFPAYSVAGLLEYKIREG